MRALKLLLVGFIFTMAALVSNNVSAFSMNADDSFGHFRLDFVSESFGLFKTDNPDIYKGRVTMKVKDLEGKIGNDPVVEVWFMWDKEKGKFYITTGKVDGKKTNHPKWGEINMNTAFDADKCVTYYVFYRMLLTSKDTETGDKLDTISIIQLYHLVKDGTIPSSK